MTRCPFQLLKNASGSIVLEQLQSPNCSSCLNDIGQAGVGRIFQTLIAVGEAALDAALQGGQPVFDRNRDVESPMPSMIVGWPVHPRSKESTRPQSCRRRRRRGSQNFTGCP